MKNEEVILNSFINALTTAGGLSGDPSIAMISAVLSPIVTDFAFRKLSPLQTKRLCNAIYFILGKCKLKNDNGERFRQDSFITENEGEQAQQVLEGILQNIADEHEKKKLEAHANFFTNLCFDERILFEQALYLTRVIKQLSYRQFILIAISHNSSLKAGGWQFKFKNSQNSVLKNYADLFGEIQSLEQMKIIEDTSQGFALGGSSAPFRLSLLGQTIYEELDLESISEEDKRLVEQMISEVNKA